MIVKMDLMKKTLDQVNYKHLCLQQNYDVLNSSDFGKQNIILKT